MCLHVHVVSIALGWLKELALGTNLYVHVRCIPMRNVIVGLHVA